MNRYTMWIDGHGAGLPGKDCYTRLAEYEDTGLESEEIIDLSLKVAALETIEMMYDGLGRPDHLRELVQAEKDGRLVVLPCKVGDAVFLTEEGHLEKVIIEGVEIKESGVTFYWAEYESGPEIDEMWDCGAFELDDIGRTVFMCPEEAEKALEEK